MAKTHSKTPPDTKPAGSEKPAEYGVVFVNPSVLFGMGDREDYTPDNIAVLKQIRQANFRIVLVRNKLNAKLINKTTHVLGDEISVVEEPEYNKNGSCEKLIAMQGFKKEQAFFLECRAATQTQIMKENMRHRCFIRIDDPSALVRYRPEYEKDDVQDRHDWTAEDHQTESGAAVQLRIDNIQAKQVLAKITFDLGQFFKNVPR
jgi:hypothetical protein